MLERMGWKEGKGLGVQEAGSIHPISVRKKDDNLGEILLHRLCIKANRQENITSLTYIK
jgi:hypothetical protein